MPRLTILLALVSLLAQAAPAIQFDSNRAWEHLRQLVSIGPRPSGTAAIGQARTYIKDQLAAVGLKAVEQTWIDDTPIGKLPMANLIATIGGTGKDRIIIAGHYDTKRIREFRFVGANDGGSSAAFLIELARVLKARKNPLTIDLVFFDGEEAIVDWQGNDNTYGSRHYVEVAKRDKSLGSLKAMILVDMIGDRDLHIRRDTASTGWLTEMIWDAARRQKLDAAFVPSNTGIGGDDHMPFLAVGVPSVDIIDLEASYGGGRDSLPSEPWHTAQDTLDAVSARSLQVVGDVVLAALPQIEARLSRPLR